METLSSMLVLVGLAGVAALVVRRHLLWITQVTSSSMAPTLMPGDRLLTTRLRTPAHVRRGDIVVVDADGVGEPIVKRVVGLPGDEVTIREGCVWIDGQPLREAYVQASGGPGGTFHVPGGRCFLLGDNRPRSSDSRGWREPYVPLSAVRGRVWLPALATNASCVRTITDALRLCAGGKA